MPCDVIDSESTVILSTSTPVNCQQQKEMLEKGTRMFFARCTKDHDKRHAGQYKNSSTQWNKQSGAIYCHEQIELKSKKCTLSLASHLHPASANGMFTVNQNIAQKVGKGRGFLMKSTEKLRSRKVCRKITEKKILIRKRFKTLVRS